MSNYYEKQEGKVKIAEALMERGWKVYGYHADESDSMTDYYSPAYWNGIAVKNGFILVVDINRDEKEQKIERYNPKGNLSIEDREKITKLEAMTQENGATAGEEENAKKLIEKIKEKISDQPAYETIGFIPAHMANPGKCKWHIEKDGKIYDKGTGITKYADIPESWEFDINKMEYTDRYKFYSDYDNVKHERILPEETRKIINDFKALILRFERVVNGMNTMGDGTKETEEKAAEQQGKAGYEKVIENITKKVIKPVQKDNITINVNDVLSFNYHGHYWIVTDIYTNAKNQKCVTYELLGSAKRGYQRLHGTSCKRYYQLESRLIKELEAGTTKIYTLQEVEEVTPVEKWVKVDKSTRKYNTDKKEEQKPQDATKQSEQTRETIKSDIYTITADTDTRDNSNIWVVKLKNRVDTEEFNRIRNDVMKPINGYYSRFKGGFIFKYDPTSKLMPNIEQTAEEVTEQKQEETITDNVIDFEEYKNNNVESNRNNLKIHELDPQLIHRANYNSFAGKRGDLSRSDYESYANKIISWDISQEKKQKILDELYKKWSEILKYEAQHVSVMVAGPARYNAKKLDKGDKILELSHYFVEWFKGLEKQINSSKPIDKIKRITEMIEFCDSRQELDPTNNIIELSVLDNAKFIEYFEKLQSKYNWRKNSTIYKLYEKSKAGEIKEIKKDIIFENADYTVYIEGDRAYIKFTMKPQRQLMVALKSRKWWWNARVNAWSTYLNKLDKEWVSGLSNQYSKYI